MVCVSMRKQHLQPDSDPVVQLGQMGQGEWHQMAEGGSLPPFHKGGLRAPKLTSPAGVGEVPAAAGPGAFSVPSLTSPVAPSTQGELLETAHPKGQGLSELPDPFEVDSFQEGKRARSTKPRNRLRKVLEQKAGGQNKGV